MTTPPRPPVIVSQMSDENNATIAAHWTQPIVRTVRPGEMPWDLAEPADILIARPFRGWNVAPEGHPGSWPGSLKWVMTTSAGVDFFPPWFLEAPIVTCGRGISSDPIAEYVMTAVLSHTKRFETIGYRRPEDFRQFELAGLDGQTLGLAGFGAIGKAVAARAAAFGMQILALRRSGWGDPFPGVEPVGDIGELAERADHLVLALPATPQTRHIVDASVLARARHGQHIVNVARGALIDQDALITALDSGRIAAATLDVTDPEPLPAGHPLYTHPKIRLTPHISWLTSANGPRIAQKVLDNLDRYARGETLVDVVDPVNGY